MANELKSPYDGIDDRSSSILTKPEAQTGALGTAISRQSALVPIYNPCQGPLSRLLQPIGPTVLFALVIPSEGVGSLTTTRTALPRL